MVHHSRGCSACKEFIRLLTPFPLCQQSSMDDSISSLNKKVQVLETQAEAVKV